MSVDASAIARVLGIGTQYLDQRGANSLYLPQRVAIVAQGASASTYSTTKRQITSAAEAGSIYGFGSPIHLEALEFFPDNGDGIGTIPLTVYPLADHGSGAAAVGDITPSGSPTVAKSYRILVSKISSDKFTIGVGSLAVAANLTAACQAIGLAIRSVLKMPVTMTWTYGTVTSAPGGTNVGNGTCTALSVTGAPIPGAWTLKNTSAVVNGGVWSLTDPLGTVVATGLTQTVGAGQATVFNTNGIQFTITDASTDFALNDMFTITVPSTKVNVTSKWKGVTANKLFLEVVGDADVTFGFTQPVNGLNNPSVSGALAQVGNVWESMFLNQMEITDTTTLDLFQTFGEGRWGDLVHKPCVVFTGVVDAALVTATAVSSVRKTDRINAQLVAPGSGNLPFVVAARELARIVKVANNNAPTDYGAQKCESITPGTDAQQWDYPTRDAAVKAGSSTIEVNNGVIEIGDVVTFYHPDGDPNPGYRYVVDIAKLQTCIFRIATRFATATWAAAPLIPDGQATTNEKARTPKAAKAEVWDVLDGLGLDAVISDPATAKKNVTAVIDSGNAKRLNVVVPVQLSGNTNVKSVDLRFSFFFGQALAA